MAQGLSRRRLAAHFGISEAAVRKAIASGRITPLPDGTLDLEQARAAWTSATDPARTRVTEEGRHDRTMARDETEAREAVSLIARVLQEEGVATNGKGIDFGKTRTAELILKARQRQIDQDIQCRRLVDRAAAEALFFATARDLRDAWLAWPARIAVAMADELQIDARTLATVLSAYVTQHLAELGEPEASSLNGAA